MIHHQYVRDSGSRRPVYFMLHRSLDVCAARTSPARYIRSEATRNTYIIILCWPHDDDEEEDEEEKETISLVYERTLRARGRLRDDSLPLCCVNREVVIVAVHALFYWQWIRLVVVMYSVWYDWQRTGQAVSYSVPYRCLCCSAIEVTQQPVSLVSTFLCVFCPPPSVSIT